MNDGGLIAKLEQWLADTLKALTYGDDDVLVFKTAEVWRHQIAATTSGAEAFTRFVPFAFVSYQSADAAREGDYDLRQVIEFAILIGVESTTDGIARAGDATHLGTSLIRDLVIAALDRTHPGGDLTCDEFYYTGEMEVFDMPRRHAIEMHFECSQMTPAN